MRELLKRLADDELSAPLLVYLLGLFGVILLVHLLASLAPGLLAGTAMVP
jgi:hypothetical protein